MVAFGGSISRCCVFGLGLHWALMACGSGDRGPAAGAGSDASAGQAGAGSGEAGAGTGGGAGETGAGAFGGEAGTAAISHAGAGQGGAGAGAAGQGGGQAQVQVTSLEISPPHAALRSLDGDGVEQEYEVTAKLSDGSSRDVTDEVTFELDHDELGEMIGSSFVSNGRQGGKAVVTAKLGDEQATTTLDVVATFSRVEQPAPSGVPELFADATEAAELAPVLVYPEAGSIAPPNLGELDVHWQDPSGASDLFEVALRHPNFELTTYLSRTPGSSHYATLGDEDWELLRENVEGGAVELTIRGLDAENPEHLGVSLSQSLELAAGASEGEIFYRSERQGQASGIYRYLMQDGAEISEPVYTEAKAARCVSCHTPAADGSVLAVTYDGGNGYGVVVDASGEELFDPAASLNWNFASFDPGASELLTVMNGALTLRSSTTGALVASVTTTGSVTHPAFDPQGTSVAYVRAGGYSTDWGFTGGSIVTRPYARAEHQFGDETVLVAATSGQNNFYPAWSPDGEFIAFNRSSEDSYADASAVLYVVDAAGELDPIPLSLANESTGLTNSRPGWSPSTSTLGSGDDTEPVMWLVFASKRDFGTRLVGQQRLQLWVSPFFPERARQGLDPSGPALRLPLQSLDFHNYLPAWVQ